MASYLKSEQLRNNKKPRSKLRKKSNRSRASDIPPNVRLDVVARDKRCIFCGSIHGRTIAHYIPRSASGLGIVENLCWACIECHHKMDHTKERPKYLARFRKYLDSLYPNFKDVDRRYNKWKNIE